jgi:steroid 5-alpha reductase family enzyme
MSLPWLIIGLAALLSANMTFAWFVAGRSGQSGWIDAIWSLGVGGIGTIAALVPPAAGNGLGSRQILVAALIAIWSLRLGLHIARRTIGSGDDPRYAQLRQDWGQDFRRRLFWFLQIQAAAGFVLVLSIFIAAHNPAAAPGPNDWLGGLLSICALVGETIADRQLAAFRAETANRGKICDVGLWARSRHPNYFFEWLGWLAYAAIAIDLSGAYLWGWLALCGPTLMYWLLVHVSGIPPLEAHMLRSRGEVFRAYQTRVNAFWPRLRAHR